MVRTKADAYTKASFKANRKQAVLRAAAGTSTSSPKASGADKYAGGNSYCPRPVPKWQKPITSFFGKTGESSSAMDDTEHAAAGSSVDMSEPVASVSNTEGNSACSNDNDEKMAVDSNDNDVGVAADSNDNDVGVAADNSDGVAAGDNDKGVAAGDKDEGVAAGDNDEGVAAGSNDNDGVAAGSNDNDEAIAAGSNGNDEHANCSENN